MRVYTNLCSDLNVRTRSNLNKDPKHPREPIQNPKKEQNKICQ